MKQPPEPVALDVAAPPALLRLEHVEKQFGEVRAVQNVCIDVQRHETLVLLGPTGCGKTTLLRLMAGLETPDRGRIVLDQRDAKRLAPHQRGLAMVFQQDALYPHMTIAGNLAFARRGRSHPQDRPGAVDLKELTQWCEIDRLLERRPHELSGGQRQRAALARALAREPRLLLLDEPFSNLDARTRRRLRTELSRWQRDCQASIVWVTHDQEEALAVADRLICLDHGRVLQAGPPTELYHEPQHMLVGLALGSPPVNVWRVDYDRNNSAAGVTVGPWRFTEQALPPLQDASQQTMQLTALLRPAKVLVRQPGQTPDPPPTPSSSQAEATIDRVEDYGDRRIVHIAAGGGVLLAHLFGDTKYSLGEKVTVAAAWQDLQWFDALSGQRRQP